MRAGRATEPPAAAPVPIPKRIEFGMLIPCTRCKTTGKAYVGGRPVKEPCPLCGGLGYAPWSGAHEVAGNAGVAQ